MVLDSDLRVAVDKVAHAATAADAVGPNDVGRKRRVRELTRFLHPDRWPQEPDKSAAEQAFAALQLLLAKETKASSGSFDVASRKRTYQVSGLAFKGTLANLYDCRYLREPGDQTLKSGLLKLPRSVRDNDLVQAEAATLKKIFALQGERRTAFFPRFEDSFKYRDKQTSVDRQALVTRRLDGFISLRDVLDTYPRGIGWRDVAWIWRRGLVAISLLHELDVVHGSIIPEHVLIHPVEHGVQLCGMVTTVPAGQPVKLTVGPLRYYPPEVVKKEEATTATDLYMFHKTMEHLLASDQPRQFRSFIKGVCFDKPSVRPQEPRELLGEYDELLERVGGPRKFHRFPPGPWGTP